MPRSPSHPGLHRSKGLTVEPVKGGWRSMNTLVYSRVFDFRIDRDEQGWFVGTVPELPGCYTQARTEKELIDRLQEAVELALEEKGDSLSKALFAPPLPK
jgi:predicted RNase H-like HicB family nuclease